MNPTQRIRATLFHVTLILGTVGILAICFAGQDSFIDTIGALGLGTSAMTGIAVTAGQVFKPQYENQATLPVSVSSRLNRGTLSLVTPTDYADDETGSGAIAPAGLSSHRRPSRYTRAA